uniref:Uncharacterized protein n=1 Tax=Trichuris muris TaxID=70415 RepID=A0A5S6Q4R1_TRIMR
MALRSREDRDDVRWRCGRKECRKEMSAKTGTWFQGCEQPIRTMLLFIRAWAEKWTTLSFCRGSFNMNEMAAVRLNAATAFRGFRSGVLFDSLVISNKLTDDE